MQLTNLRSLFVHELKDVYSAEKQSLLVLPEMIQAVTSEELAAALREHRIVTERQVKRLEKILSLLAESPKSGQSCKGMEGLLEESTDLLDEEDLEGATLDAGIIGAVQKVEHYEIAAYGTLLAYAQLLGEQEAAGLLEQTLQEEKAADDQLTAIATAVVNVQAVS